MSKIFHEQANLKQTGSHRYAVTPHSDWSIGPVLHGGSVAAVAQLVATTHFNTTLAACQQPDLLTLHVAFLRACTLEEFEVTVEDLKVGRGTCFILLRLAQGGTTKAIANASSTNFDTSLGPTAHSEWDRLPSPGPVPDFVKVAANQAEDNWIPSQIAGDLFMIANRHLVLQPRGGFPTTGMIDLWYSVAGESSGRIDGTYLTLLCDCSPSMSDTLLRNNGMFDAGHGLRVSKEWARKHPGVPAVLPTSIKGAMRAEVFNSTTTLDVEYKQRLPSEGLDWVHMRAASRMLDGGRMDMDITLRDRQLNTLCLARHTILVLAAKRRFANSGQSKAVL